MAFPLTYCDIRGFNYVPSNARNDIEFWRDYDGALVEKELDYAKRLGLNSARVFLAYAVYEHNQVEFLARVKHFVQAAYARGISTMVVVWDSCFSDLMPTYEADEEDWIPNPGVQRLTPDFWPQGEAYCADLAKTLVDNPGLLIWDVMNEPLATTWQSRAESAEQARRCETIWTFARHFCGVMGRLDPSHPRTVGVLRPEHLPNIVDCVDVVSFHDYSPTRGRVHAQLGKGIETALHAGKPVLVSEVGCLARANPYDICLEACQDLGIGWYMWELMIGRSRWRDIHGIVYPDGTVRDPSIVAAVQGFFRNRSETAIAPNIGKEGRVGSALEASAAWLAKSDEEHDQASCSAGLETLEIMANLLESGELVPMANPPGTVVGALPTLSEPLAGQIRELMLPWGKILEQQQP